MPKDYYGLDIPRQVNGRLLGFDFGLRRIGVAVGQSITHSATPLKVLLAKEGEPTWSDIDALIVEWRPIALVVGIPIDMRHQETAITKSARHFAQQLKQNTGLPVFGMNECLSSEAAKERIKEQGAMRNLVKDGIDAISAQIILEGWLREYS